MSLVTPVAMLVFNRPEHTARVFEAVRSARPERLFVVADGPRAERASDAELCDRTRGVFERVDWPCEVTRLYSPTNLGCRGRVGSGISEVFSVVDRCIFLEDDCLPEPGFFRFCQEMLDRYERDERIFAISGDSFPSALGGRDFRDSYFFTRYIHIWGWATWRRAWRHYDGVMSGWPALRDGGWLRSFLDTRAEALFWTLWFEMCHDGRLNTWDIPWVYSAWAAGHCGKFEPLAICPGTNLVTNIGFDGTGTHVGSRSPFANLPTHPMEFPLRHPGEVVRDLDADGWTQRHCFTGSLGQRFKRWKRFLRLGVKAPA